MLAFQTGISELVMSQEEARQLAESIERVRQFYPSTIDEKQMAWLNLAMVAGSCYGTRMLAYRARVQQEASGKNNSGDNSTVVPFSTINGGMNNV